MRLFALAFAAILLATACTLSNQSATPTTLATLPQPVRSQEPTALPGLLATPGPTWTPFGNQLPTQELIAPLTGFPTLASGESAEISSPASYASVSALPLYVSGVAHNLTQNQFTLQVFDGSGQPLTNGQTITLSNPNNVADVPWSASVMVRSYTGAAQIRILAQAADGTNAVIGSANVTIIAGSSASIAQPMNGTATGTITSPANGTSASGDPITVAGTAGGIPNNQFTLLLLDSSGTVLNSQVITLTGADQNAVPWSASLGTSGHTGAAEIRAVIITNGQQTTIASVTVTLQ